MGKIKDIFQGPHRKFAWFVVVSTTALILLWIFGPGHTFIHWGKAAAEVKRQEKIIEKYETENADLDRRINMMQTRIHWKSSPESSIILLLQAKMFILSNNVKLCDTGCYTN